jgi:uncharacterized membrane protein
MALRAAASLLIIIAAAPQALAGNGSDADVLAIVQKHCVMCHAARPTHESVREAPKNVILETTADLKKYAAATYAQTVQSRAMPLGNQTGMTDDERMMLGRWLKGLP